jgi:hypothetical protein
MGGQTADCRQVSDITRTLLECHLSFMSYSDLILYAGCIRYVSQVREMYPGESGASEHKRLTTRGLSEAP